jgi:hypothetical protein
MPNATLDSVSADQLIDEIFCIRKILQEKLKYKEPDDEPFIDFKKTYELLRREIQKLYYLNSA